MQIKKVIHLSGPMGGGKGTVAQFLKDQYGFSVFNLSQIVKEETERNGLELTRENMNAIYDEPKTTFGEDIVAKRIVEKAEGIEKIVFDGSRDIEEAKYMRKRFPNILSLYIDADEKIRKQRIITRQRDIDSGDLEKLFEKDNDYVVPSKSVPGVIVMENNGNIEQLFSKIQTLIS